MPLPARSSKCSLHIKLGRILKSVTKIFNAKKNAHLERWKSIEITESHCEHESILQHALDAEKTSNFVHVKHGILCEAMGTAASQFHQTANIVGLFGQIHDDGKLIPGQVKI